MPQFAEITYQLAGYTSLDRMEFVLTDRLGEYDLTLVLTKGSGTQSATISARFHNVSRLVLQRFGGGLTQLLGLAVEDVSGQQWDRVRYRVFDAERDMISFFCRDIAVSYH